MISQRYRMRGFTLVEIAVVLVIVSLLIGAGFSSLGAFLDNSKQSHTNGSLLTTKQALLNYVKVNKHMPCPDTDGDGQEDRVGSTPQCSAYVGTVPYDDIGLARATVSDDYSNLFGYAVHKEANSSAVMGLNVAVSADEAALLNQPGSYFYNVSAPVFNLETPPTALNADDLTESYRVCKRDGADDCSGTNDVEVEFIPAVLVAFNENGGTTDLDTCTGSRGTRESQNCDTTTETNPTFVKGVFSDGLYDDQIVMISAYEIKEQALGDFKDPPTASSDYDSEYAGYDVIIRSDVDSSNDLNVANGVDNAFYIDENDDGSESGSLNANVVFKEGDDKLYVSGDIEAGGDAKMGAGDDEVTIEGNILARGSVDTGTGNDIVLLGGGVLYRASLDMGDNNDIANITGTVGGTVLGDGGDDTIKVFGDVTGNIDMGNDNDTLYISADIVGGDIDGGSGTNTLHVYYADQAALDAIIAAEGGSYTNFDTIVYGYAP